MLRKIGLLAVLLAALAVTATGGAVAQQNTTATPANTTTTTETVDGTRFYGDDAVRIVDWTYTDGTFTITFHATREKLVTMTAAPAGSGEGSSPGNVKQVWIGEGRTTVQMNAPTGDVWLSTSTSVANGRYTALSASKDNHLLAGPYTGSDVRNAGIGGALGVALAVLYEAVAAKIGTTERGERMA
jgi:hypothetical protein